MCSRSGFGRSARWGPLQALTGFLATFGCFTLIGYVMVKAGVLTWAGDPKGWRADLPFDIGYTLALAVDAETLTAIHLTGIVLGGGDLTARIIIVFLPWFAFGCVLDWARWCTGFAWLPGGLLMGWMLADRLFSKSMFAHLITQAYAKREKAGD
jgi:hypothetical protein